MALAFYEKAKVLACPKFPDRVGLYGHVLGKSYVNDDPDGELCRYSLFFEDVGELFSFRPDEVVGTGDIAEPLLS